MKISKALKFRLTTGTGYLVRCDTKNDFDTLISFLKEKGVQVEPCEFDGSTYNVISVSNDKKHARKKMYLSYYGNAIKKYKVKVYDKVYNFIKEF